MTHFQQLSAHPEAYHIFLALRVIEAEFSDAPQLGVSHHPRQDAVRLGQEATMAFPPTTICEFKPPSKGKPGRLTNLFFGLFGPHGPLPPHLTEYARERQRSERDPTLIAFANMLTHRLMGLLYRAWTTGQLAPGFDRGEDAAIERKVAALAGYHGQKLRRRDAMPDLAKRHFTGHLARGPKNAEGLTSILSAFFRTPVHIKQFVGSWLELEPGDRWQLGSRAGLGQATAIGSRVWSRAAKFRLEIGPLSLDEYCRLLPETESMSRLIAIVRNYVDASFDWDVNLVLRAVEVPSAILGKDTRLGQTSWIGERGTPDDARDLYVTPHDHGELAAKHRHSAAPKGG